MGYTTSFSGAIDLNRKLTLGEARTILEIATDNAKAQRATGIDAHFQWVPSETLNHIVWDGNEKFYKYIPCLIWLCKELEKWGIKANGILYYQGENVEDNGTITVIDNIVNPIPNYKNINKVPQRPLTMRGLEKMALDMVTKVKV